MARPIPAAATQVHEQNHVARRSITYRMLLQRYLAEGAGRGNVLMPASHLDKWLLRWELTLDNVVTKELHADFDRCLSEFLNALSNEKLHTKTIANIGVTIRGLRKVYVAWLANSDLPTSFNEALRKAIDRKGYTLEELKRQYLGDYAAYLDANLDQWLRGKTSPSHKRARPQTETILAWLETLLDLPENTLKFRAFARDVLLAPMKKSVANSRTKNLDDLGRYAFAQGQLLKAMAEIGHRILDTLPPPSRPISRALQYRNGMLLLLITIEPLQASRWPEIRIGHELFRDEVDGRWSLSIPALGCKSATTSGAQDRPRVLPSALQQIVQTYIEEHRQYLYKADATDLFLLKNTTGDWKYMQGATPRLTAQGFYSLVAGIMATYLGFPVSLRDIQHIVTMDHPPENTGD